MHISYSPVRKNCLFGPCDPQMSLSRLFSREAVNVFGRFMHQRARGLPCTGQGLMCARAVNIRAVDAVTVINNAVIESLLFCCESCSEFYMRTGAVLFDFFP